MHITPETIISKIKDGEESLDIVISDDTSIKDHLPVWRKICFAIGGIPYQMTNAVISFFFSIFLLEVAEVQVLSYAI
jgi:hypothetical protein